MWEEGDEESGARGDQLGGAGVGGCGGVGPSLTEAAALGPSLLLAEHRL